MIWILGRFFLFSYIINLVFVRLNVLTYFKHYGYTFDDVFAENIYTTDMKEFEKVLGYRISIYKKQFPTGTWLEVKGLAVEGQLIEIDMEAHKAR